MASELKQKARLMHRNISHLEAELERLRRYSATLQRKITCVQARLDAGGIRPSVRRELETRLQKHSAMLVEKETMLKTTTERVQKLTQKYARLKIGAVTTARPAMGVIPPYQLLPTATETVLVRLLSGDILSVLIDPHQPVSQFAQEVAGQHGYNPKVIHRFDFILSREEDEEEKETPPSLGTSGTWSERFPSGEYPLLHLLIQEDDRDMKDIFVLLKEILAKKGSVHLFSEEETMEKYKSWYLTYQPPTKSNRYIILVDFIEAHPQWFPAVSEEKYEAVIAGWKELMDKVDALHTERARMEQELYLLGNTRRCRHVERQFWEQNQEMGPDVLAERDQLRPLLSSPPAFGFHRRLRLLFSPFELAQAGWHDALCEYCTRPFPEMVPSLNKLYQFHQSHLAEHGDESNAVIETALRTNTERYKALCVESSRAEMGLAVYRNENLHFIDIYRGRQHQSAK